MADGIKTCQKPKKQNNSIFIKRHNIKDNHQHEQVYRCLNSSKSIKDVIKNAQLPTERSFCCNNDIEQYKCEKCNFQSNLLVSLILHVRSGCLPKTSDQVAYKCLNCHLLTCSRLFLLRHVYSSGCALTKNKRKKQLICYRVGQLSSCLDKLADSKLKKIHWSKGEQCSAQFKQKTHRTKHEVGQWFSCDHCPSKFEQLESLKTHLTLCHIKFGTVHWCRGEHCAVLIKEMKLKKS